MVGGHLTASRVRNVRVRTHNGAVESFNAEELHKVPSEKTGRSARSQGSPKLHPLDEAHIKEFGQSLPSGVSYEPGRAAVDRLRELGVRGVLLLMAKNGQILEVRCEMPQCYCPKGRKHFDDKSASSRDWTLSFDHYPRLASDGGRREPGNARLSHVLCNRVDYGWRLKIRAMLNKGMSLEAIAAKLNRSKVRAPHGSGQWTAATVRKAQVS